MNKQTTIEPSPLGKLREPFPPNQISKLPKETGSQAKQRKADIDQNKWPPKCDICGGFHHIKAVHLDYVGHAAATDRLLDTDPTWTWEPLAFDAVGLPAFDQNGGLWIKLTVCGVTRLGYGSADGKSGGDAKKEIIGDAIRNAGMRFGMALDLWHKGDLHVEDGDGKADDTPAPVVRMASEDQVTVIRDLLPDAGVSEEKLREGYRQVNNLADLTEAEATNAIKRLEKTIQKKRPTVGDILDDEVPY